MMQKTVYQNEIKTLGGFDPIVANIGHNKFTAVALAGVLNIASVEVNSEIIRSHEVMGIGSRPAGHVQNSPGTLQVVVGQHRRKLLLRKRRLPKAINQCMFENGVSQVH